jgi:hypothetical protein
MYKTFKLKYNNTHTRTCKPQEMHKNAQILGPCVPSKSFRYNRLIAIIFAYFNRESNRFNRFVKS